MKSGAAPWLLAVLCLVTACNALVVPLNVLILTIPGFTGTDFIQSILQGYGVPFKLQPVELNPAVRLDYQQLLYAPDGSPLYGGIVMYPNIEAMGHLNQTEVNLLWSYQRMTGARALKFGAWPTNVGWGVDTAACSSASQNVTMTADMPLGISGIKRTAPVDLQGLYRCPGLLANQLTTCSMWAADFAATGIHPACNVTAVATVSSTYLVGTLVAYADGRESLAFMHDCGGWSTSCLVLGHVSVSWLLRDAIPGLRQALLTIETDDVFLTTDFDPDQKVNGRSSYRLTPTDMAAHITWQTATSNALPPGSQFVLDLPINGNGVLEVVNSGTTSALDIDDRSCEDFPDYITLGCTCWLTGHATCPVTEPDFCRNCTKDWPKPRGFGSNRVAADAPSAPAGWSISAILAKDPLANAVINSPNGEATAFFWCHHTFSHENLDNATTFDADQQIGLNQVMAGSGFLNLLNRPNFSKKCMVTPQISGLVNGDALAALVGRGIGCAAGDNTWAHLRNNDNVHHMLYTTVANNGYDGFAILPRWATEVYYNCSTATQNTHLYNRLYESYWGYHSTIDQIMQREATRVVREGLLKLRKDPHMMHQANWARFDGISLVQRWTNAVVAEYNKYALWPVNSLKIDDLYAAFLEREGRDNCLLTTALDVATDGSVSAVVVSSAATPGGPGVPAVCSAPLLLSGGPSAGVPRTVTVQVAPGSTASIPVTGVAWAALAAM